MSAALAHRGPDGAGHHLDAVAGLAIRRLALVDPVGGEQPIANEDGAVHVVCNGELYDHRALRRGLERRGHTFRTRLGRRGARPPLRGARAGVRRGPARDVRASRCGTRRARRLVLARDPFGIKPLVYAQLGRRLAFASELKALLALPDFPRDVDPAAVEGYLALNAVPAPATIFRAARKLEPGHRLIADAGGVRVERYARPRPAAGRRAAARAARRAGGGGARAAGGLRARAPRRRRAGRRPALRRRRLEPGHRAGGARRRPPLQTFSVGFDVAAFDELAAARARSPSATAPSIASCGSGRRRWTSSRASRRATTSRRATPPRCRTGCSRASPRATSRRC